MLRGHTFFGDSSQGSSMTIQATKRLRISAYLSASLLLVFGLVAVFPVASSMSSVNAAKKSLEQTTLSMTSSSFYANPKVTSATGTFTSSSTEISVSTDNYTGYTIGIAAKTDDSDYSKLKSVDGELNSISSATSEEDFSSVSGTSFNGLWGYKPSMLSSTANTYFLPAPTFAGDELNRTNSANEQADTYTISLGARADASTPYGRYQNSFILRTVANPIGVSFVYNKNTEDNVTNMPANIAASISDEKITVSDTVPERSGYDFTGWCDGSFKHISDYDYCEGDLYEGGDDFYLDKSSASVEVDLYAMWKPAGAENFACNPDATSISEAVCMQDVVNDAVRSSMTLEQQYRLFDSRDGKKYYVAKLADGNVWMTQDLDFELDSIKTLTHADTDLGWVDYDENATWTPEEGTIIDKTQWDGGRNLPQSYKDSDVYYIPSGTAGNDHYYDTLEDCVAVSNSRANCEHWKSGVYYNFAAAVATNDPNADVLMVDDNIAPDSVCPAGWRLPYGSRGEETAEGAGDFVKLLYAYGYWPDLSNRYNQVNASMFGQFTNTPLFLIRNGVISSTEYLYKGIQGHYTTNTTNFNDYNSTSQTKHFEFYSYTASSSYIYTDNEWGREYGFAVRCVARNNVSISFDANGGEGTMSPISSISNVTLPENEFTREGYGFHGWNTEADDSGTTYYPGDKIEISEMAGKNITLYARWYETSPHTINYIGRNSTNTVVYDHSGSFVEITKVSHTVNVDDTGYKQSNYGNRWTEYYISGTDKEGYSSSQAHVVTIPGATKLNVTIYYNGEGTSCDWVTMWAGKHPDYTASNNYGSEDVVWDKLGGYSSDTYTVNGNTLTNVGSQTATVEGDSVTFGFRSDGSSVGQGYGYYAIVTARIFDTAFTAKSGSYVDGENLGDGEFIGWNQTDTTALYNGEGTYKTESEVLEYAQNRIADGYTSTDVYAGYGKYTTITFDANNGSNNTSTQTIAYPKTANLNKNTFTREGHDFYAWNDQPDGSGTYYRDEQAYSATEMNGANVTLYAQWSPKAEYTINYHNGENVNTVKYNCWDGRYTNREIDHSPNVADDGTKTSELSSYYDYARVITIPNATRLHVKLTYGSSGISNTFAVLWQGSHPDYDSWNNSDSGVKLGDNTTGKYGGTNDGENMVVEGYIAGDTVTVGFYNTYGYTGYGYYLEVTVAFDEMLCDSEPVQGQYVAPVGEENDVFTGWSFDNTAALGSYMNEAEAKAALTTDNTTVDMYAIWAKPTIIKFDNNNGNGTMNDVIVEYGEATVIPDNRFTYDSDSDVRFAYWNTMSDNNGTQYSSGNTYNAENPAGETTILYAIWGMPTYYHFDNNGGQGENFTLTVSYNTYDTYVPGCQFTKENATFYRWSEDPNDESTSWYNPYEIGRTLNANNIAGGEITLYAIWGYDTIFHFNANGGLGEMQDFHAPYGRSSYLPDVAFGMYGAKFSNWNTAADNTGTSYDNKGYYSPNSMAGGEITLYAIWGWPATLHFEPNGGTGEMEDITVPYNQNINLPAVGYSKEGTVFAYWNTEIDRSGTRYDDQAEYASLNTDYVGTLYLYAIWGYPTYFVYHANGGNGTMDTHRVDYNTDFALDANTFTREGMRFVGWNTQPDGTGTSYTNQQVYHTGNVDGETIELYAIWASSSLPQVNEYIDSNTGRPEITIARAYEIAYTAAGKGMYVPHKDPETGEYDGTYFEATQASDYSGIPAEDYRFAMQDMTTSICQSVTVTWDDHRVLDLRDYKTYHITKMNDGSCWMTQNLDYNLASDGNGGVIPLTSETSDINLYGTDQYNASTGYSYENGVISWTPLHATADATNVTNNRIYSVYSASGPAMIPFSVDVGNWYWKSHPNDLWRYVGNSGIVLADYTDTRPYLNGAGVPDYFRKDTAYDENGEHGSVGNYYSWTAAVATNDGETFDFNSVHEWNYETDEFEDTYDLDLYAKNSICPKGWKLPRYGGGYKKGDGETLYEAWYEANGDPMYLEPYYFVRAGHLYIDGSYSYLTLADYSADLTTSDSGHITTRSSNGLSTWWHSLVLNMDDEQRYIDNLGYAGGRRMTSVRCVAR